MGIFGNSAYGRGGFHLTWIIALVIAGFGLFRYLTHTETNPITGESQHVAMSPSQEVALGLQAAPRMAAQMGGEVPASDPSAILVRRIGQQLVSDLHTSNIPWKFQFHLLNDPRTINAFALPGGQIFITKALFDRLQNTAQLAGVLGHEMGHVVERHAAQQMAAGQLGQSLQTAVLVGSAGGSSRERSAAYAAALANQMLQLHYSRADESQADSYGVKYMAEAGYDPRQMIEVMRILKEASAGRSGPQFLATHPDPGNRAQAISQQIQQMFPQGVPASLGKGEPIHGAIQGDSQRW